MLMIGLTRYLVVRLVSPGGPSGRRYNCDDNRAGGWTETGGASGVNSGGEGDEGEDRSGGRGRDGNSFADNGKAEDP